MSSTWVVTGANRGLGLEFARQLHERGVDVVATARKPEEAGELEKLGVRVEPLDVSDPASITTFADRIGGRPIEVLINNAGVGVGRQTFADENWDDIERYFRVNSIAPMRITRALLDELRSGGRKVVHVTSRMGSIGDNSSGAAYGYRASKAALNMMNRSLSIDLSDEGFIAVVLHPGWVATDMGGSGAPLNARESVAGMLGVIDGLGPDQSGKFLDHSGAEIPW